MLFFNYKDDVFVLEKDKEGKLHVFRKVTTKWEDGTDVSVNIEEIPLQEFSLKYGEDLTCVYVSFNGEVHRYDKEKDTEKLFSDIDVFFKCGRYPDSEVFDHKCDSDRIYILFNEDRVCGMTASNVSALNFRSSNNDSELMVFDGNWNVVV